MDNNIINQNQHPTDFFYSYHPAVGYFIILTTVFLCSGPSRRYHPVCINAQDHVLPDRKEKMEKSINSTLFNAHFDYRYFITTWIAGQYAFIKGQLCCATLIGVSRSIKESSA